ncbi:unnamed protein product, partial [marine sediment metagenome]
ENNGIGLAVDGNNPVEIREAIRRLKNNPEVYQEMAEKARKLAEKKYCWEKVSKKLVALYKNLR